jgi:hypothetical protein
MTIKITDFLKFLTNARKLDIALDVREDEDGDYLIRLSKLFSDDYRENIVITKAGLSDWNKGASTFDVVVEDLECLLAEENTKRIKKEKRKQLIESLTPEQRELLDL